MNILSLEIRPLKSDASNRELFKITIDGVFATFADVTHNGEFSIISILILEEDYIFSLSIGDLNGAGLGLPLPSKSLPLMITSNLSLTNILSIINSTSFLEEPLTIDFKQSFKPYL